MVQIPNLENELENETKLEGLVLKEKKAKKCFYCSDFLRVTSNEEY